MNGIILYGPPASGKDTITKALNALNPRYRLFPRLKAGDGRSVGYRMTNEEEIDRLRETGDVVWENRRYGACYVIDRLALINHLAANLSVLHLGQIEAITAVRNATPETTWLAVYVWCPREIAAQRITLRDTGDDDARLQAWDETPPLDPADLIINTDVTCPDAAACEIDGRLWPNKVIPNSHGGSCSGRQWAA